MKRKIILYVNVILIGCLGIFITSCKEKPNNQYEKFMKELVTCQEKLECCTSSYEALKIQKEYLSTTISFVQLIDKFSSEERKNFGNKLSNLSTLFLIKNQIINQTSTLNVKPTKKEMQELSQKCAALTSGDITQVNQIVKDFWKEKRDLN